MLATTIRLYVRYVCIGIHVRTMYVHVYVYPHYPMQGTYAGQFVMEGFLNIHWARWKRVLLTRSVAMVPCIIIAIIAVQSLDYLDEYINVEQSMLVRGRMCVWYHGTLYTCISLVHPVL